MNEVRLIYVSRMTEECDMRAIQDILAVSRKNNQARRISGVLCYDPAFFLQCLEGPRTDVNDLYRSIQQDPRHRDVTLLEYCDIEERLFSSWAMGFVLAGNVDRGILAKYTGGGKFSPYALTAQQARDFLVEIAAQLDGPE
ncbi:MAG: BLUF domain-containing protein [Candidatus Hydrogenedentes bacterium]|nr:BLUF domain-containing protein [Candidatus Hydrogenedentota bacterium]